MPATAISALKHRIHVSDNARYLTAGQIRERFGVSDMWVRCRTLDAGFPKPVKFSNSKSAPRFWQLDKIEQWDRERARINGGAS